MFEGLESNLSQGAAKGGVIKGGVYKHNRTQTSADFRLSEMGPKPRANARKRDQTQTNANEPRTNVKSKNFTSFDDQALPSFWIWTLRI